MKAYVNHEYGSFDNLKLEEVSRPLPNDDEVLVKIKAASVNFNNLMFVTGKPLVGRPFTGFFKPKIKTTGNDIAGIVEATGKNVTKFKEGDEVFADIVEHGFGAFAEYVCVPEDVLVRKPTNLSFEESAAVPEAGLVALQAIRDFGKIEKGQKVLINGASGGIGTFAVQIAKYYEAEVTGVCGPNNVELVRSLGADNVINYTQENFAITDQRYDLIIATAGDVSPFDYKKVLNSTGRCIVTGGSMKQIFKAMLIGPIISEKKGRKITSMTVVPNKDLEYLKELIEAGKVKPVIDKIYDFDNLTYALKHYSRGHAKGKVVITMN